MDNTFGLPVNSKKSSMIGLKLYKTQELKKHRPDYENCISLINKADKTDEDLQVIKTTLGKNNNFLQRMSSLYSQVDMSLELCREFRYVKVAKNQLMFKTGDRGENYYFIIHGSFSLLYPQKETLRMTLSQFEEYLSRLKRHEEFELLERLRQDNFHIVKLIDFYEKLDKSRKTREVNQQRLARRSSILKGTTDFLNFRELDKEYPGQSVELYYINRVAPLGVEIHESNIDLRGIHRDLKEIPNEEVKYNCVVYIYKHIKTLQSGDSFGEIALESVNCKRSVSFVSKTDVHLAYISKAIYLNCIKSCFEIAKKTTLDFIVKTPLLYNFSKPLIEKKLYSHLEFHPIGFKEKIVEEGDPLGDDVIFLKTGEFELSISKSVLDCLAVLRYFGFDTSQLEKRDAALARASQGYASYRNERVLSKLSIINDIDIYGLSDSAVVPVGKSGLACGDSTRSSLYTITCKSVKGECFTIKRGILMEFISCYTLLRRQLNRTVETKKDITVQKLANLVDSRISIYERINFNFKEAADKTVRLGVEPEIFRIKDCTVIEKDMVIQDKETCKDLCPSIIALKKLSKNSKLKRKNLINLKANMQSKAFDINFTPSNYKENQFSFNHYSNEASPIEPRDSPMQLIRNLRMSSTFKQSIKLDEPIPISILTNKRDDTLFDTNFLNKQPIIDISQLTKEVKNNIRLNHLNNPDRKHLRAFGDKAELLHNRISMSISQSFRTPNNYSHLVGNTNANSHVKSLSKDSRPSYLSSTSKLLTDPSHKHKSSLSTINRIDCLAVDRKLNDLDPVVSDSEYINNTDHSVLPTVGNFPISGNFNTFKTRLNFKTKLSKYHKETRKISKSLREGEFKSILSQDKPLAKLIKQRLLAKSQHSQSKASDRNRNKI